MTIPYIPKAEAKLDEWLENFAAQLPAIATLLGIAPVYVAAVTAGQVNWDTTFDAKLVARNASQAATELNDEAKVTVLTAVRIVVGLLQAQPNLTDVQRQTLGITVPDLILTPSSPDYVVNLAAPILLLESKRGQVVVHFGAHPSNEKLNAKPTGIAGAKIWFRQDSGPWNFVADDTNSPYTHNFYMTEPLNAEYRAQWFDGKMRVGPFSETAKCSVTP